MKKLFILLLFIPLVSFGQTKDGIELCLAAQKYSKSFITDTEAENALDRILSVIGASKNFTLQSCDEINNALAITYRGNRYILYDKKFMQLITQYSNNWSNMFILAHEVGHHINGHTRDVALNSSLLNETSLSKQRQEELEADKFAGFVLAKLGAPLNQTLSAINLISPDGDDRYSTHPNKNKRIEAVRIGYNSGYSPVTTSKPKTKKPVYSKPSAWQKVENKADNPFENDELSAYTIGETKPSNSSNISVKPKLTIDSEKNIILSIPLEIEKLKFKPKVHDNKRIFEIIMKSNPNLLINQGKSAYLNASKTGEKSLFMGFDFEIIFDDKSKFERREYYKSRMVNNYNPNNESKTLQINLFASPEYNSTSFEKEKFIKKIKSSNKMFIKFNFDGYIHVSTGLYVEKNSSNKIVKSSDLYKREYFRFRAGHLLKIKDFNPETYYEFNLSGSSNALNFIKY